MIDQMGYWIQRMYKTQRGNATLRDLPELRRLSGDCCADRTVYGAGCRSDPAIIPALP